LRQLKFRGPAEGELLGQELGRVLALLPQLEVLSLSNNFGLAPVVQQQALWAAWCGQTGSAGPTCLRSLELQTSGIVLLPPHPALRNLHTLVCDWCTLCDPEPLSACRQLRLLRLVFQGPPWRAQDHRAEPGAADVPRLVQVLRALPQLRLEPVLFLPDPSIGRPAPAMPTAALLLLRSLALAGSSVAPLARGSHDFIALPLWVPE